jgi:hypothetical protein
LPRVIDETGSKHGFLTVLGRSPSTRNSARWVCQCDCGATITVDGTSLRKTTKSCGCLKKANASRLNRSHGLSKTPTHRTWIHMWDRCRRPSCSAYPNYGGRGITVCERWRSFENFLSDMKEKPSPLHSIERINNDSNYEPGNCRWATRSEQDLNKRTNRLLEWRGKTQPIAAWEQELGISRSALRMRLRNGWTVERALSTPVLSTREASQRASAARWKNKLTT